MRRGGVVATGDVPVPRLIAVPPTVGEHRRTRGDERGEPQPADERVRELRIGRHHPLEARTPAPCPCAAAPIPAPSAGASPSSPCTSSCVAVASRSAAS